MAYEALIPDEPEKSEEAKAPDPMEAVNAQLAEMRAQINAAYQQNKGIAPPPPTPQVQYVPYPVQQEAEPEGLSEADILADLPGAIQQEAERIAAEREQKLREELAGHLSVVYEKDFDRDMQALAGQPHYKFVEEELKAHFQAHPEEKYQPGRLQEKYSALVGSKIVEIRDAEEKAREEAEANLPAAVRSVDHAVPTSSSPVPASARKAEDEVELSDEEERNRQFYNRRFRLDMGKREYAAFRDGKAGPSDGYNDTLEENY